MPSRIACFAWLGERLTASDSLRTRRRLQVLTCAGLPHLVAQPLAVAAWVQLAAAVLNIATCRSTCRAALEGRPWMQRQYMAAAALMQQLTSAAPVPAWALAAPPELAGAAADPAAALSCCCAIKAWAWLAGACTVSLWLLHRRELMSRLAWAQRQQWRAKRLAQELQWALLPRWAALGELAVAASLAWQAAALLLSNAPRSNPTQPN